MFNIELRRIKGERLIFLTFVLLLLRNFPNLRMPAWRKNRLIPRKSISGNSKNVTKGLKLVILFLVAAVLLVDSKLGELYLVLSENGKCTINNDDMAVKYMNEKWLPWTNDMVDEDLVKKVLEVYPTKKYVKGQHIFEQGETSNKIFLLLEGRVEVNIVNKMGKKKILGVHEPKCFFGEIIIDKEPRPSSAICLTSVKVAVLDSSLHLDSEYYERELFKTLFFSTNYKLRVQINQLSEQTFDEVEERVEKLLLGLCNNFGKEDHESIQVNLPLTHQLIADFAGCSRVRVSQILNGLSAKNHINFERDKITFPKHM